MPQGLSHHPLLNSIPMDKDIQPSCPAADPQPVVQSAGMAAIFIVLSLADGDEAADTARDALGEVPAMLRTLNLRLPGAALSCVIGIGHDAWPRLFPDHPRPKGLHPMKAFKGAKHTAPATPGDLLLHIRATRTDACFELAMRIREQLGDAGVPVDEGHGFRYLDARSMVGFVDGTENPQGQEAVEATLIGDEDPAHAGGSYVIVQKYIHDMTAWNALPVSEQEKVIGSSKHDDIEMSEDEKPANSHSAIANIGDEFKVFRDNMPFGTVGNNELGTYFICYASTFSTVQKMLKNMFMGVDGANYDRLLDFSTAVTGTLFFVPPMDKLGDFAG